MQANTNPFKYPPLQQNMLGSPPFSIPTPSFMKNMLVRYSGDFNAYWKILKKYFAGQISKVEFQAKISKILTSKEKVALHNWFILSILKAAYSGYIAQQKTKNPALKKHTENFKVIQKNQAFRTRMLRIASQYNIQNISEEAISMLVIGLHQHILRSLSASQPDVVEVPPFEDTPPGYSVLETTAPDEITGKSLEYAIWRKPGILYDSQNIIEHRLSIERSA
ncbi:uncharacterized protein LOC126304650 isoform X2 [Schistocerca gregaria]|uniref:uncharacterized protein LOC126304650 isoform X2 n=1 Tax=Schistocerca gregaria TaxID=7010 RepID=UPI00211E82DB|nr:uncharacterized protein LOC126304650 isoform X2 [Schistocerca gregaria]